VQIWPGKHKPDDEKKEHYLYGHPYSTILRVHRRYAAHKASLATPQKKKAPVP
jgi:hypothetical protein